jgi:hypothetical protein
MGEMRSLAVPGFKGRYRVAVLRPDGSVRYASEWFDNLVTDVGLNRIGVDRWLTHCHVGSSNREPEFTDVELDALVAITTGVVSSAASAAGAEPYYGRRNITFRFPTGAAAGNLAEVGVGWSNGLFSRALFIDAVGNQTTITVLSDETLDVTYEVQLYSPPEDISFSATILGVARSCTLRAAYATSGSTTFGWGISGLRVLLAPASVSISPITAFDGALGPATLGPSGVAVKADYVENFPYVNNSLEQVFEAAWLRESANFVGGIKTLLLLTNGLGAYQIQVDPPIMKTSALALTLQLKVSWNRCDLEEIVPDGSSS